MKHKKLYQLVEDLYINTKEPFGKWMWPNHVVYVADFSKNLAQKYKANLDLSIAAALLHDIGDVYIYRFDQKHEQISNSKAQELLEKADFAPQEIKELVEVIIPAHSCHHKKPPTLEGQILSTGDAMAHLLTDFYLQFCWKHTPQGKSYAKWIDWAQKKLDRDYKMKICFEDERQKVKDRYLGLKLIFDKPKLILSKLI
jgi:putative nucleotidyltransferase with HDIG domain